MLKTTRTGNAFAIEDVAPGVAEAREWTWDGPEVVRTYPSDEAIKAVKPENGGRWVPFTIKLIFRDARGGIIRKENYSSKEYERAVPAK